MFRGLRLLDKTVSITKMAKPIKMPFWCALKWAQKNHVIGGGAWITKGKEQSFWGALATRPFNKILRPPVIINIITPQ